MITKIPKISLKSLLFIPLFIPFFTSCNKPTYPKEKLISSIKEIAKKEYNLNIKVKLIGKTLWVYVPTENLLKENFELNEKEIEKLSEASFVSSRVVFSSDANITFIPLIVCDKNGIEIRLIRHLEDIKKFRVMYISQKDYLTRSNLKISLNPEIFGQKIITGLITDIKNGNYKKLKKYFKNFNSVKKKIYYLRKYMKGPIKKIESIRTDMDEALIYIETKKNKKFLFQIDSYFSELIKNLLILYFSKESIFKNKEKSVKNKKWKEDKTTPLRLSIIKNFWYLNRENWPKSFENFKAVKNWKSFVYGNDIKISDYISQQLKNRFQKKFDENYDNWKIEFDYLNVSMKNKIITIIRKFYKGHFAKYDIDPDHELLLIVKKTIMDYSLDVNKVIIKGIDGEIIKEISKNNLLKLKKKKWKKKKLKKLYKKRGRISVLDILRLILNPYF